MAGGVLVQADEYGPLGVVEDARHLGRHGEYRLRSAAVGFVVGGVGCVEVIGELVQVFDVLL